jgi:hypothetical protein
VDRLQYLRRNAGVGVTAPKRKKRIFEPLAGMAIALGLMVSVAGVYFVSGRHVTAASSAVPARARMVAQPAPLASAAQSAGAVWLVKKTAQFDLYSNGLRIENQYTAGTEARRYLAFARAGAQAGAAVWRSDPAGIVFHTTESHIAPFEEDQNQTLQRAGEGLLEFVNRSRAYHFVIDRFGRVFRVVRESDYANHAGNSVWADGSWIYVNLNQSFFGVAFEAQSQPAATGLPVTAAQVHAGRVLTEMLRARYGIAAANCVAHAQVSVNPGNYRAGYHVDWAANLPFGELGLGDNYQQALASVTIFGFEADDALIQRGSPSLVRGIDNADAQVRKDAETQGMSLDAYRKTLQRKYRDALGALRGNVAPQLNNSRSTNHE